MALHFFQSSWALRIALLLAFLLIGLELSGILWLNQGHLVYALDDPYIHLALAENIWRGHYGVNLHEFSSASSSIIWPFLIAPLSIFESSAYAVLALNSALMLLSIYVVNNIITEINTQFSAQAFSEKARFWLLFA